MRLFVAYPHNFFLSLNMCCNVMVSTSYFIISVNSRSLTSPQNFLWMASLNKRTIVYSSRVDECLCRLCCDQHQCHRPENARKLSLVDNLMDSSLNKMKICEAASRKGKSRFLSVNIYNPGHRQTYLKGLLVNTMGSTPEIRV